MEDQRGIRKHLFTMKVVKYWNGLPSRVGGVLWLSVGNALSDRL